MQVKYAVLQRSYSAPVRVCGMVVSVSVVRAMVERGTDVWFAVRVSVFVAVRAVVPRFDFVVFVVRAVVPRFDDVLRGTSAVVRAVFLSDLDVVEMRCWVGWVVSPLARMAAFPSRTAASDVPIPITADSTKTRIFFISDLMVANL